jgi:hypothetical protein
MGIFFYPQCTVTLPAFTKGQWYRMIGKVELVFIVKAEGHKTVRIKVCLLFLLDDRRIWIRFRSRTYDYWIRIRIWKAQKHTDLQH